MQRIYLQQYILQSKKKIKYDYINVGGGEQYSIKKIVHMLKRIIGYKGKITFNKKYPDGVKKRKLDSTKIKRLGWKPKITLKKGLEKYCDYYLNEIYPNE